ncbi:MAG: hypothetical protein AAGD96_01575, partial [Chloroflexota bacterium]
NDKARDLYKNMNLRGFSRKERTGKRGPDLWVREKAGEPKSWRWLESLCRQYNAYGFYIRPEYTLEQKASR